MKTLKPLESFTIRAVLSAQMRSGQEYECRDWKLQACFQSPTTSVPLTNNYLLTLHKVFSRCFPEHLLLAHVVLSSSLFILETHFGKVW